MFTKLKNRLVVVIMAISSVMLTATFLIIYLSMQFSLENKHEEQLAFDTTTYDVSLVNGQAGVIEFAPTSDSNHKTEATMFYEAQGTLSFEYFLTKSDNDSNPVMLSTERAPSFTALFCYHEDDLSMTDLAIYGPYDEEECAQLSQSVMENFISTEFSDRSQLRTGNLAITDSSQNQQEWKYRINIPQTTSSFMSTTDVDGETVAYAQIPNKGYERIDLPDDAENHEVISIYKGNEQWYEISFVDTTEDTSTLQTLAMTLIILGIFLLVIIFIVSRLFAKRAIQPVESMWEQQNRFVADASHELKTPLATMMSSYDVVMMHPDETVASQSEWLTGMRDSMDRMKRLIVNLLTQAQADDMSTETEVETDLSRVIPDELQLHKAHANKRGLTVSASLDENVWIKADEDSLHELVSILLDNAISYADENGEVSVSLRQPDKNAVLKISNDGPGISSDDLEHVFDRFFRVDKSRTSDLTDNSSTGNQQVEHHGLGLSIAKTLVETMGGAIAVESTPGVLTTFTVELPASR